jgi:hypothetical protein
MSGKKTAIVTGASGSIGAGLVEGFLGEGYNVVATSRDANQKFTASGNLVLLNGDIGKQQTATDAVEAAIKNFGTVDVLVNNAGIFLKKPFTDFTSEDFDAVVSARRKRDAKTEIGMRCEHKCGTCRPANRGRKCLRFDDNQGWVEFGNAKSRSRVCKRWHPL